MENRRNAAYKKVDGVCIYLANEKQKKQGKYRVRLGDGKYHFSNDLKKLTSQIKAGQFKN